MVVFVSICLSACLSICLYHLIHVSREPYMYILVQRFFYWCGECHLTSSANCLLCWYNKWLGIKTLGIKLFAIKVWNRILHVTTMQYLRILLFFTGRSPTVQFVQHVYKERFELSYPYKWLTLQEQHLSMPETCIIFMLNFLWKIATN